MLHLLATHPATARFISYKLARRFVADEPPAALVDRAAATFRETDGDIREVVRTIVTSPEFFAPEHRQAKVKTPFEFVVSAVRASGAEVEDARALAQRVAADGDAALPAAAAHRLQGHRGGLGLDQRPARAAQLRPRPGRRPRAAACRVAPDRPGATASRARAGRALRVDAQDARRASRASDPARMAGLILGSPEFQRR